MLMVSCARWMHLGLLWFMLGFWKVDGLIEMVEEQQCHDQQFRLTCRDLDTHIAVLEAWYTSTEEFLQNTSYTTEQSLNQTNHQKELQTDLELNQVYVYSSPKHNGYYELTNRSLFENTTQWSQTVYPLSQVNDNVNGSFEAVNDTVEITTGSEGCGVKGFLRSYASWKEGDRRVQTSVRNASINLRAPLSYRCTGVNHCSFILKEDFPPSLSWSPGVVYIKYACFDDTASVHFCNREVLIASSGADSEGYVRTPGYPHYYVGDKCRWKLRANTEQRLKITLLDVSLRSIGPYESECTDYVTVIDSTGETLLSSCDQVELPLKLITQSNAVEIVVRARSKGAFPKRGVLLHYKSINCVTLSSPSSGYLLYRNERIAHYVCNVNHVFTDTHKRARILWCYDDNRWNDSVPSCIEETALGAVRNDSEPGREEDTKLPPNEANMMVDIVIPSLLIAALFIGNAFIVLIIYKYRKRKTDDMDDEFNTIPLNLNGNMRVAGNAV